MSNFGFKFDGNAVNPELYGVGVGNSYPIIVWHGKYTGSEEGSGFWTLDREESESPPGPYWEGDEVRFGSSPDAPFTPVWKTERLRACVIGVRKRVIITGDNGEVYTYPWLTKKTDRAPGSYKAHFQIAVTLPNTGDRIFQISLRGVTKTKSWGNPENGGYHDSKMPPGVEILLRNYTALARKETGTPIPELCSFWLDLIPLRNDKGKKVFHDVGHGTHVSSFTADFGTGEGFGLDHRFVGMENFVRFQALRENELLEWEKVWNQKGVNSAVNVDPYETPESDLRSLLGMNSESF